MEPPRDPLWVPLVRPLLDRLARSPQPDEQAWAGWQITRIHGGRNNLLYRAARPGADLAVKFTLRDARDRAGREYHALLAVQQAGLDLAPAPVLLERRRYELPVVVQTWLAGEVSSAVPATDGEWLEIVEHLARLHTAIRRGTRARLPAAVLTMRSAREGVDAVREQIAYLPSAARPPALQCLARRLEAAPFPTWRAAPRALCRGDSNIRNFVRRPGHWASVDWEYAGWGDPAFELADLCTHVAYASVPAERWAWVIDRYCERSNDPAAAERIDVYRRIMAVWWLARTARYLTEVSQGRDQRLVPAPDGWEADMRDKYEHYRLAAEAALA